MKTPRMLKPEKASKLNWRGEDGREIKIGSPISVVRADGSIVEGNVTGFTAEHCVQVTDHESKEVSYWFPQSLTVLN